MVSPPRRPARGAMLGPESCFLQQTFEGVKPPGVLEHVGELADGGDVTVASTSAVKRGTPWAITATPPMIIHGTFRTRRPSHSARSASRNSGARASLTGRDEPGVAATPRGRARLRPHERGRRRRA